MPDARAVVAMFLTALEERDVLAFDRLLSEDVIEVLPLSAAGGTEPAAVFRTRAEVSRVQRVIVDSFSRIDFRDPEYTVSEDGRVVFVETVGERLHRDSGLVYRNVYLLKFQLRDGLICHITEYSNPINFARFFDLPIG